MSRRRETSRKNIGPYYATMALFAAPGPGLSSLCLAQTATGLETRLRFGPTCAKWQVLKTLTTARIAGPLDPCSRRWLWAARWLASSAATVLHGEKHRH